MPICFFHAKASIYQVLIPLNLHVTSVLLLHTWIGRHFSGVRSLHTILPWLPLGRRMILNYFSKDHKTLWDLVPCLRQLSRPQLLPVPRGGSSPPIRLFALEVALWVSPQGFALAVPCGHHAPSHHRCFGSSASSSENPCLSSWTYPSALHVTLSLPFSFGVPSTARNAFLLHVLIRLTCLQLSRAQRPCELQKSRLLCPTQGGARSRCWQRCRFG